MQNLDPFLDKLELPPVLTPLSDDGRTRVYRVTMKVGHRRLHAKLPNDTPFWGYEGLYPGPTIDVPRDRDVVVTFINALPPPSDPANPRTQWPFAIPADAGSGMAYVVPERPWTVVHLHGSPNPPDSDGWPDNAYLPGGSQVHHYPRQESAALLWYHDHANMITRLNVYAGLAGLFLVRDAKAEAVLGLPVGPPYEIPLVLQNRDLEVVGGAYTGRFAYKSLDDNATFDPTFLFANGILTPYVAVEPRRYRLRLLNAANSTFFRLKLMRPNGELLGTTGMTQVGVDGGFLPAPVVGPRTRWPDGAEDDALILAPAERADVLLDLSPYAGGQVVLIHYKPLTDNRQPFLRFDVATAAPVTARPTAAVIPTPALPRSPRIAAKHARAESRRPIGLFKVGDMQTINGRLFHDAVEEAVKLDTTEVWEIFNATGEQHPIHLHLVNFEVLERQAIEPEDGTDPDAFGTAFLAWRGRDPATRGPLPDGWRFAGDPVPADANEALPKDTVRVSSPAVTRIRVTFRLRTGTYMYHCHILEHEDMEMMRPLLVVPQGMLPMPNHHHGHG